jgi:hypothetical protein
MAGDIILTGTGAVYLPFLAKGFAFSLDKDFFFSSLGFVSNTSSFIMSGKISFLAYFLLFFSISF